MPTTPVRIRRRAASSLSAVAMIAAVWAGGCASSSAEDGSEVTVFAAASLTDAFTEIATAFEAAHPGVEVKLNFAGSQSLRTQISHGAQAHVFASANEQHMAALRDSGLVSEPAVFATNEMVIAVPASNPAGIESFADLPKARRIVLAGDSVPAGAYAAQVLANAASAYGVEFPARVSERVVSREMHVRQTLQKVVLGEADAAMVYATDAAAAGDAVRIVEIPDELNVRASYPIAALGSAAVGEAFVAFVQSEEGARVLRKHGFRPAGKNVAVNER